LVLNRNPSKPAQTSGGNDLSLIDDDHDDREILHRGHVKFLPIAGKGLSRLERIIVAQRRRCAAPYV
jgi:hypothetical protein